MARFLKTLSFFFLGGGGWFILDFVLVSRIGKIQPDAQILNYCDATFASWCK